MSITYVGGDTDTQSLNNTDLSFTQPTHAAGDVGVCIVGTAGTSGNTEDFTTATEGWVRVRQDGNTSGMAKTGAIFYKVYKSASEPSLVVSVNSSLSLTHSGVLMIYRGVDTLNPIDGTAFNATSLTDTITPDHVDITTNSDNGCLIVSNICTHGAEITTSGRPATPTGIVQGLEVTANNRAEQYTGYKLDYGTAGAISIGAWTHTGSAISNDNIVYSVALQAKRTDYPQIREWDVGDGAFADPGGITVTLPAHQTDDLLMVVMGVDGASGRVEDTGNSWSELLDDSHSTMGIFVAYKFATSASETNPTFTQSPTTPAEMTNWVAFSISGVDTGQAPEVGSREKTVSTSSNPPSITPTGGAKNYMWLAFSAIDEQRIATAWPTNYQNTGTANRAGGANDCSIAWGWRGANAASEDPAAFTWDGSDNVMAVALAVHPAPTTVDHYYAIYTDGNGASATDANVKAGTGTGVVTSGSQLTVDEGVQQSFTATGLTANTNYDLEWVITAGGTDYRASTTNFTTKLANGAVTILSPPPIVRH